MRLAGLAATAIAGAVALLGFAGAAQASATVDLIWIDVSETNTAGNPVCLLPANRNCAPDPRSLDGGVTLTSLASEVALSDNITLGVILTAGPNGSVGGGVSVNYGDALPKLGVVGFQSLTTTLPLAYLPVNLGTTTDRSPYIDNINAAAAPPVGVGIGLPPGASAYLGTVTFHEDVLISGSSEISVGTDGPGRTDDLLDLSGRVISSTTTFNSAYLVNVPNGHPVCDDGAGTPVEMQIEVNALRAGGKRISAGPSQTRVVTAKARIVKGTAVRGTTIVTTLAIEAEDATGVMSTATAFPITLGVGRGGKGDRLTLDVPRCDGGSITFVATFSGTDSDGDLCEGTRQITKTCR